MSTPSGKFVIRLSPDEHASLRKQSLKRGVSLNRLCQERLFPEDKDFSLGVVPETGGLSTDRLLECAKRIDVEVIALLLIGSVARGEAHGGSDVDLLMVVPTDLAIDRSTYSKWESVVTDPRFKSAREVSVHFVKLQSNLDHIGSLWLECALEGRVLYETESKPVSRRLCEIRRLISHGRWRRKMAYGRPYWVGESP